MIGFDDDFAPICLRDHSYRYDNFDSHYKTLKYTCSKECANCPLQHDSLSQKIFKIRQSTDVRNTLIRHEVQKWNELYKERTAVERVNVYLKEFFDLDNDRHHPTLRIYIF